MMLLRESLLLTDQDKKKKKNTKQYISHLENCFVFLLLKQQYETLVFREDGFFFGLFV